MCSSYVVAMLCMDYMCDLCSSTMRKEEGLKLMYFYIILQSAGCNTYNLCNFTTTATFTVEHIMHIPSTNISIKGRA